VELQGNVKEEIDSGTSFSSPYVAAAAAMVLTVKPNLTSAEVQDKLIKSCVSMDNLKYSDGFHKPISVDQKYLSGTIKNHNESDKQYYGYGMPLVLKALELTEQAQAPVISVSSGIYNQEFSLTISAEKNAKIYYTTDESYPSANNGNLYTKPISINSTTSVQAIAYVNNKAKSITTACECKMEFTADQDDFIIDNNGCYLDLDRSGIINDRDYVLIKQLCKNDIPGDDNDVIWGS